MRKNQTTAAIGKPFHESIVKVLNQASPNELVGYGALILKTTIVANHNAIIGAWVRATKTEWYKDKYIVVTHLEAEKARVETIKTLKYDPTREELRDRTLEDLKRGDKCVYNDFRGTIATDDRGTYFIPTEGPWKNSLMLLGPDSKFKKVFKKSAKNIKE